MQRISNSNNNSNKNNNNNSNEGNHPLSGYRGKKLWIEDTKPKTIPLTVMIPSFSYLGCEVITQLSDQWEILN